MMKILGIDIGTNTGYCYNQGDNLFAGTWTLATAKEIKEMGRTRMDRKLDLRPIRLYQKLTHLISEYKPDVLIFEDVEFMLYRKQTQLWSSLRGALWLACDDTNLLTECVPVKTLKKFAGHGNANKVGMAKFALKSGYILPDNLDDNGIDAFWLWLWGKTNLSRMMYETDSNSSTGNAPECRSGTNRRYPNHSPAGRELASRRVCK